jgi:hypothetical protein
MLHLLSWITILFCLFCLTACSHQQGIPKLEISLQKLDIVSREIVIQLTVTNVGDSPLVLPQLSKEKLTRAIMWGGWMCSIRRTTVDDFYGVYGWSWRRPPEFKKSDLMTLKPGEVFAIMLDIADAEWMSAFAKDYEQPRPALGEIAGEYAIYIRLGLGSDSTGESNVPLLLHWRVWQGSEKSNIITFVVEDGQGKQTFTKEANQIPKE